MLTDQRRWTWRRGCARDPHGRPTWQQAGVWRPRGRCEFLSLVVLMRTAGGMRARRGGGAWGRRQVVAYRARCPREACRRCGRPTTSRRGLQKAQLLDFSAGGGGSPRTLCGWSSGAADGRASAPLTGRCSDGSTDGSPPATLLGLRTGATCSSFGSFLDREE